MSMTREPLEEVYNNCTKLAHTGLYQVMLVVLDENGEFVGTPRSLDDVHQLLYVVSGRIRIRMNESNVRRAYHMNAGTCLDIGANTFYQIIPLPPADHPNATVYGAKFWICCTESPPPKHERNSE